VATAQERRSNSLRAMWRLDEALECSNEAVTVYRDLGARWELASALGDRGVLFRLLGRLEDAERDVREALHLCRDLGDRVLVVWTASELATTLVLAGRLDEARDVIDDNAPEPTPGPPGDRTAMLWARVFLALAQGEREVAAAEASEILRIDRETAQANSLAVTVWWVGNLFGPDAVGGTSEMDRARRVMEDADWVRAFREIEQLQAGLDQAARTRSHASR
jgi:tetratricopeptide (TPR) repeat protein